MSKLSVIGTKSPTGATEMTNTTADKRHLSEKKRELSVDQLFSIVRSYGKFQKTITLLFCFMMIPTFAHVMITYFTAHVPSWMCSTTTHSKVRTNQDAAYFATTGRT